MKQKFLLFFFLAAFSYNANAQIDVTVNPVGLLFSSFSGGVDLGFTEDMSAELLVSTNFNKYTIAGSEYKNNGFGVGAIGKYYFGPKNGCDKWHVGPYVKFGTGTAKFTDTTTGTNVSSSIKRVSLGVGLYGGYKVVSAKNIVFDIGFGMGRNFINKWSWEDGSTSTTDLPFLDYDFIGKLAVGYRFGGAN